MSVARTRYEIESVIRKVGDMQNLVTNVLPGFGAFLTNKTAAYLSNGVLTSSNIVDGGTGYVTPLGTVVLPPGAPGGCSAPTVTLGQSGGVINSCTVTDQGSGMGIGTTDPRGVPVIVTDTGGGSGAIIFLSLANTVQLYNFTASEVIALQGQIALDYTNMGKVLSGTMQSALMPASITVTNNGTGYTAGNNLTVSLNGLQYATIHVVTVSSGAINVYTVSDMGFGAFSGPITSVPLTGGSGSGALVTVAAGVGSVRTGSSYDFTQHTEDWNGWSGV